MTPNEKTLGYEKGDVLCGAVSSPDDLADYSAGSVLPRKAPDYNPKLRVEIPISWGSAKQKGVVQRCTASALCNAIEMQVGYRYQRNIEIDDIDLWDNQEHFPGTRVDLVHGDTIRSALRAARKFGVMASDGSLWRISDFYLIQPELHDWIKCSLNKYVIYTSLPTMVGMTEERPDWTTWTYARLTGTARFGGSTIGGQAISSRGISAAEKEVYCRNPFQKGWGKWGNSRFSLQFGDIYRAKKAYIFELEEVTGDRKEVAMNLRRHWKDPWYDKTDLQLPF